MLQLNTSGVVMGIMDFIGKQFIDVISWTDDGSGILAYRFPMTDREIQNGAQLTVSETQLALFVNEGKIADLFSPGLHTLSTRTLPILTNLKNWDKAFASPFKSDVYFFSTREQLDQRWGTTSPVVINDRSLGPIRIRAHGTYSYRVSDPKVFFTKISGTMETVRVDDLDGQIRSAVMTHLASYLGKMQVNFVELAGNQILFSDTLKSALSELFTNYGLTLVQFFVQSLSLPDEVQAHLDKITSLKLTGDLKTYTQFQTAESIPLAAKNEGGAAGAGIGLGAGLTMGQAMANAMGGGTNAKAEDPMETINKLHSMLKSGVITQQEFEAKKTELLKKIT